MNPVPSVPDDGKRAGADLPTYEVVPDDSPPPHRLGHREIPKNPTTPEPPRFKIRESDNSVDLWKDSAQNLRDRIGRGEIYEDDDDDEREGEQLGRLN